MPTHIILLSYIDWQLIFLKTSAFLRGFLINIIYLIYRHFIQKFSDKRKNHINGLEGFWGYLKRNLASKGGIRRERIPFYLAEYVWRFNHRNYSVDE